MARGCALIDSRPDTAKIGSDGRVEVHRARLRAVFGGRKTFPHGLDPQRTSGLSAAVDQLSATSTTAWAKACGASWGRLCPMPPSMVRCAYLPENFPA